MKENIMKSLMKFITLALLVPGLFQAAYAQTTVTIEYPYPELFDRVHQTIIKQFETLHPDIKVNVRTTYDNYEDATQKVLRQAMTNTLPDITFQGLNRFRVFVDRGIAQPMNAFIEKETDFDQKGFHEGMFNAGKFSGRIYALPFAISLPISYYNMDLVKKAGYTKDTLPRTWEEVFELAAKIDALGDDIYGMYYDYGISGNWLWQALNFSREGSMLSPDEKKVAFDGPVGKWAIHTFADMISKGKQPNRSRKASHTDFVSGHTGIYVTSTSLLARLTENIGGQFELVTARFPSVTSAGRLPAGGNGAMIVTRDPEKQKAAWEVIKFWCGPEGSEVVARHTGYMPPNQLAVKNLNEFYAKNPNNMTAVQSLPHMTGWYAFPGANGLKITDIIFDGMDSIATGKATDPDAVLADMTQKVQRMLPR